MKKSAISSDLRSSTSPHLHMSHPRHTGRVLPRSKTSYPVLVMIVLCVGVLLAGMTQLANASTITHSGDYTVNTSVPGPPPTVAASIDSPTDGTHFGSQPTTVSGSCPLNTYVKLSRNKFFSGVAECDASGAWSVTSALFPGANQLQAQVFSYTDQAGPVETPITIYYDAPVVPNSPGTTSGSSSSGNSASGNVSAGSSSSSVTPVGEPLVLKADFTYQGVYVGDTLSWQVDIEGGQAPYGISINWGDGSQQVISRAVSGTFTITHVYKKHGGYHGTYPVKISGGDAGSNQTFLQLLAIVNDHPTAGGGGFFGSSSGSTGGSIFSTGGVSHILRYAWPSYGVTVLMLGSFWLGERRELGVLTHGLRHRH